MIKENKKYKKKGFTLVELLAVIAVLGLILIIAIPKVMDTLNTQKKRTLELTAKSIIKAGEEKYIENVSYGINEEITCESVSNITNSDFESCKIEFDENGNASVTLIGKGRYDGLYVCNGTKTNSAATKEECKIETIVTYIKSLYENETTRASNGLTKDNTRDQNIRYSGPNSTVKNYVEFGNTGEKWRIIGIFNVTTSSGKTEELVKLVREDSIGNMSWDSSANTINYGEGVNEWSEADLKSMLNTYYIGNSTSCTYCDSSSQATCTNSCNDTVTPINSTYKNMIETVRWNTGAWDSTDTTIVSETMTLNPVTLYNGERGTVNGKICTSGVSCNDNVERTTTWEGLVALPYVTDWGYASNVEACKTDLYAGIDEFDFTNAVCKTNNWMHYGTTDHMEEATWMLSPVADPGFSYVVSDVFGVGAATGGSGYRPLRVRPTIYLKSNIRIKDGDGSSGNPYKLKLS